MKPFFVSKVGFLLFSPLLLMNGAINQIGSAGNDGIKDSPSILGKNIPDFNFAAVGDLGCNSNVKETVNSITNDTPKLVLVLGDLSYQTGNADCWFKLISPIDDRVKIVLGDHDYRSTSVLKQYKNHFNLSQEYYSFDYLNIHFIALATEIPFDINSSQYNYVKNDLQSASKNHHIKWIVVYSYRPQYSSPAMHPGNGDLRDTYHPLFQKFHVDLILQAHNHNYQRSYPISYNKVTSSNPAITDSDDINYKDPSGQIYVTVGTGGAQLQSLNGKAQYIVTQYVGYGFLDISITEGGTKLIGNFYANTDGQVIDTFSIKK